MKFFYVILFILTTLSNESKIGDVIDSYQGISVYYNGNCKNVSGRHKAPDGYNYGLKWQCVEFVKRFYYKSLQHKMPNQYGHAKDFFNKNLDDVAYNKERGLMQYRNTRYSYPEKNDILVYGPDPTNPFGHLAIVTDVYDDYLLLIQQNMGNKTRQKLKIVNYQGIITVADFNVLGWLRKVD